MSRGHGAPAEAADSGRVAVVGSTNADLIVRTRRHPRPGETLLGEDLDTLPGGKGANQAVAAAWLGAAVQFVGAVGRDAFVGALAAGLVRGEALADAARRAVQVGAFAVGRRGAQPSYPAAEDPLPGG